MHQLTDTELLYAVAVCEGRIFAPGKMAMTSPSYMTAVERWSNLKAVLCIRCLNGLKELACGTGDDALLGLACNVANQRVCLATASLQQTAIIKILCDQPSKQS